MMYWKNIVRRCHFMFLDTPQDLAGGMAGF